MPCLVHKLYTHEQDLTLVTILEPIKKACKALVVILAYHNLQNSNIVSYQEASGLFTFITAFATCFLFNLSAAAFVCLAD